MSRSSTDTILSLIGSSAFAVGLAACGGGAADTGQTGAASSAVTLISPGTENSAVHLRWFPRDSDLTYSVKLRHSEGAALDQFQIEPSGCTSVATAGFTSGVCAVELPLSDPSSFEIQIEAQSDSAPAATKFVRIRR